MTLIRCLLLCLCCLVCHAHADDPAEGNKEATSEFIREIRNQYRAAKGDSVAQEKIVRQAIAAGGRVPKRLRSIVLGDYEARVNTYWSQVRKLVVKTKETSLDVLLKAADPQMLSDRKTLLQLANLCDRLQVAATNGDVGESITEAFKIREEKVIEGIARRKKISIRLTKDEQQVLKLTNLVRKQHGLGKLELDTRLVATARDHCLDMQKHNFFAHESPVEGKQTPFDRATHFGTTANAENLAAGNATPAEVVQGWLESPGHRSNLLQPDMKRTGVGRVGGYWTALYGL